MGQLPLASALVRRGKLRISGEDRAPLIDELLADELLKEVVQPPSRLR